MTISGVWSGVLSWLAKWRLTRWEFDPRTRELRDVVSRQADHIKAAEKLDRKAERERDEWQRTAAERLVEIHRLGGLSQLALQQNESDRVEFRRELESLQRRYDGHADIDTYKKSLDELREKYAAALALNWSHEKEIQRLSPVQPEERRALETAVSSITSDRNKWKALAESRDCEITKLNREYATLRAEHAAEIDRLKQERIQVNARFDAQQEAMDAHLISQYADKKEATIDKLREENAELRRKVGQSTTIRKLQLAREESKRLRAKLSVILDRNGAIFDHPEYRKVARRLRALRENRNVIGRVLRLSLETERKREIGKPFQRKCEFDFSVSATPSPKTDILDTICGVKQVPQSERGPLVNGC